MHAIYEYLQRTYKTGPLQLVDGQPQEKPFQEYPKWVTDADGKRQVVKNLQEEIRVAGKAPTGAAPDPLQAERDKLAAESAQVTQALSELEELKTQMRAQLAELEQARAGLQHQTPPVPASIGAGTNKEDKPATAAGAPPATKKEPGK